MVTVKATDSGKSVDDALNAVLNNPDVQASLVLALEKLPMVMEQYASIERALGFVTAVLKDKESLTNLMGGLKQELPPVTLDRETLVALLTLLDKLPKLVRYVTLLETGADFVESILTDKESMKYLLDDAKEWVEPWESKVRQTLSHVEVARKRAESDNTPVSVFSLMKLLKEPAAQRGVHFLKAFLEVVGDHS
jgi:uncharacterized protein YjgD (DUF1641 family)